ncbi:hypothetical protein E2562_015027 [Oryza meyeriana var. granulata]|uniref:GLTSCR protein conserved domain-containing protein n=1 Tax=Oryza meyeriana var. granulata TaxID=110450 RepID=A0A6G1EJF4_9ORYZ|nr:hypothetical protein E2562_015027 [Oryza meyeriana var. granulata]
MAAAEEARARERVAEEDARKACCNPDLKTPFASVEDAISRLLPYTHAREEWDDSQEAEATRMAEELEKQVLIFNAAVRNSAATRTEERLKLEKLLLADEQRMSERVHAVVRQRQVAPLLQQLEEKAAAGQQRHVLERQAAARHQQLMREHPHWSRQELMQLEQRWRRQEMEAKADRLRVLKAEERLRAALQAYVEGGEWQQPHEEEEQRMLQHQQAAAALQRQRAPEQQAALQKQLMLELQQAAALQQEQRAREQVIMLPQGHPGRGGTMPWSMELEQLREQQHRQGVWPTFVVPRAGQLSAQAHRAPPQPARQAFWAPAQAVPQQQAHAVPQPQQQQPEEGQAAGGAAAVMAP